MATESTEEHEKTNTLKGFFPCSSVDSVAIKKLGPGLSSSASIVTRLKACYRPFAYSALISSAYFSSTRARLILSVGVSRLLSMVQGSRVTITRRTLA